MILVVCANPSVDSFWSFDKINKGTTNRSHRESFYPGGKGIHVAFALDELGKEVVLLGAWGGETGKWLQNKCRERNIIAVGPHVDDWTRICITNRSSNDWNETELLGAGPTLDSNEVDNFISTYQNQIQIHSPKAIIISGSAANGFESSLYYSLITFAKKFDIPAYLDAAGRLLEQALESKPFAVHINQNEGKNLCGEHNPAKIALWLSNYCSIATVTAGQDGLFLLLDNKIYHAYHKLDPSEISSTIGAGDCLLAGLCLASLENDNHKHWATYAVACGSANCIHPELGMLKADDVTAFLSKITVETFEV